ETLRGRGAGLGRREAVRWSEVLYTRHDETAFARKYRWRRRSIFMQQGGPLLCRRPTAAPGRREPSHGGSSVRARIALTDALDQERMGLAVLLSSSILISPRA